MSMIIKNKNYRKTRKLLLAQLCEGNKSHLCVIIGFVKRLNSANFSGAKVPQQDVFFFLHKKQLTHFM